MVDENLKLTLTVLAAEMKEMLASELSNQLLRNSTNLSRIISDEEGIHINGIERVKEHISNPYEQLQQVIRTTNGYIALKQRLQGLVTIKFTI